MKTKKFINSNSMLAYALLAPSVILLLSLVAYPMIYNVRISFFDQPINPRLDSIFVGLQNYTDILTDVEFFKSLGLTVLYTVLVVIGSTVIGLGIAIYFNRPFKFRKIARSLIILSYVTPSISLIFGWKYMFNTNYGIINYIFVDLLHWFDKAPLWFDYPVSSFILVVFYAIWRYFPYAFISFLAILQTLDKNLYEAASIDGANAWQKFKVITLPSIMPVLVTIVTLRSIWMFYMFDDVYLLTNQVNILGIYLYKTAFAFNDLGKGAAISVILFIFLFFTVIIARKKVDSNINA